MTSFDGSMISYSGHVREMTSPACHLGRFQLICFAFSVADHHSTAWIHPFLDPLESLDQHFVSWFPGALMISNSTAKKQATSLRATGYRQLGGAKIKGD